MPLAEPLILGIDLGTTNSLGALVIDGAPAVLRDAQGRGIVPSLVAAGPEGALLVGEAARAAAGDPAALVYSVKRLMGRSVAEVAALAAQLPYALEDDGGVLRVRLGQRAYTPQELSAAILDAVRRQAEAALGVPLVKAIITVPAYFDDRQRAATRDAGRIAGLEVVRIINEPTAAALAYGLDAKKEGLVAIYDLGGGTFDLSVLKIQDGVFQVLATSGDTALGGDDFDRLLAAELRARHTRWTVASDQWSAKAGHRTPDTGHRLGAAWCDAPAGRAALRRAAEAAKCALSAADEAAVRLPLPGGAGWETTVTRAEFEALIAPLVERSFACVRRALADAGRAPGDFDDVVCVGGSTRVPLVRRRLAEFFGRPPHVDLNPEEVVALGAALQGEVLAGRDRRLLLLDVIPLSLGIETRGGAVSKLLLRNAPIPAEAEEEFSTFEDHQTQVLLHVVQGERELVQDCQSLGRFVLAGIPPMPAGLPRVAVTFRVDASGLLTVRARELRSGTRMEVQVQPTHSLSKAQVDALVRESIARAPDDFRERKRIELRNKCEGDLRATRRQLPLAETLWPPAQVAQVRAAVAAVEAQLAQDDLVSLENAWQRLSEVTVPLAEALVNYHLTQATRGKRPEEV